MHKNKKLDLKSVFAFLAAPGLAIFGVAFFSALAEHPLSGKWALLLYSIATAALLSALASGFFRTSIDPAADDVRIRWDVGNDATVTRYKRRLMLKSIAFAASFAVVALSIFGLAIVRAAAGTPFSGWAWLLYPVATLLFLCALASGFLRSAYPEEDSARPPEGRPRRFDRKSAVWSSVVAAIPFLVVGIMSAATGSSLPGWAWLLVPAAILLVLFAAFPLAPVEEVKNPPSARQPGGRRWVDYWGTSDPVPNGDLLIPQVPAFADQRGLPVSAEVELRHQPLGDHSAYFRDPETFVGSLLDELTSHARGVPPQFGSTSPAPKTSKPWWWGLWDWFWSRVPVIGSAKDSSPGRWQPGTPGWWRWWRCLALVRSEELLAVIFVVFLYSRWQDLRSLGKLIYRYTPDWLLTALTAPALVLPGSVRDELIDTQGSGEQFMGVLGALVIGLAIFGVLHLIWSLWQGSASRDVSTPHHPDIRTSLLGTLFAFGVFGATAFGIVVASDHVLAHPPVAFTFGGRLKVEGKCIQGDCPPKDLDGTVIAYPIAEKGPPARAHAENGRFKVELDPGKYRVTADVIGVSSCESILILNDSERDRSRTDPSRPKKDLVCRVA